MNEEGKVWVVCIDTYDYSSTWAEFLEKLEAMASRNAAWSVGQQIFEFGVAADPKKYTNEPLEGRWYVVAYGQYGDGRNFGAITQDGSEFRIVPFSDYQDEWNKT